MRLCFAEMKSWLTGRRLVSLPFSDHCEPLVDSEEDLDVMALGPGTRSQPFPAGTISRFVRFARLRSIRPSVARQSPITSTNWICGRPSPVFCSRTFIAAVSREKFVALRRDGLDISRRFLSGVLEPLLSSLHSDSQATQAASAAQGMVREPGAIFWRSAQKYGWPLMTSDRSRAIMTIAYKGHI